MQPPTDSSSLDSFVTYLLLGDKLLFKIHSPCSHPTNKLKPAIHKPAEVLLAAAVLVVQSSAQEAMISEQGQTGSFLLWQEAPSCFFFPKQVRSVYMRICQHRDCNCRYVPRIPTCTDLSEETANYFPKPE